MKLNVPFYEQTSGTNCGPCALKMILEYFGDKKEINALEKEINKKEGKATTTIQLAIAASSLGYISELYSKHLYFNEENLKEEFYKKYAEEGIIEESKKLVEEARKKGIKLTEKSISLNKIIDKIKEGYVPLILLDWNVVKGINQGYSGHFVPIVGYDDSNIYIHNQRIQDAEKYMNISNDLFDKARKAKGTDEDILFIKKK